jgi:hypothetical protein
MENEKWKNAYGFLSVPFRLATVARLASPFTL